MSFCNEMKNRILFEEKLNVNVITLRKRESGREKNTKAKKTKRIWKQTNKNLSCFFFLNDFIDVLLGIRCITESLIQKKMCLCLYVSFSSDENKYEITTNNEKRFLFNYFKNFADSNGSTFVTESKSTELRKTFEWFHANSLTGLS